MIRAAALLVLALGALGCGGSSGGGPADAAVVDVDASPSCVEARDHSDLEWLQSDVVTPTCAAFSACHKGEADDALGLNLESGNTMASLVDVVSQKQPDMVLVAPGAPADSYVLVILGHFGVDDPRIDPETGTMPYNLPLLCVEKRDAIARWIESL
jgi:hypothetical protein